jgi:hypothetical protein
LVRAKRKRNNQILTLHKQGVSRSTLAAKHNVTNGRIAQIVAATIGVDARRAELELRYGKRPNIARLGDDTPFDVLILSGTTSHGWAMRVLALSGGRNPIRTLGELRGMTDGELMSRRGVGAGLFAEMRALCPYRARQAGKPASARAVQKPRASAGSHMPRAT